MNDGHRPEDGQTQKPDRVHEGEDCFDKCPWCGKPFLGCGAGHNFREDSFSGDTVMKIIRASDPWLPQIELTHGCWTISPDSKTIDHHIHNSDGGENYHIRFEPRRVVDSALVLDKIVQVAMKQGNGINWNQPDCTYYLVRALNELFARLQASLCPMGESRSIKTAEVWRRFTKSLDAYDGL